MKWFSEEEHYTMDGELTVTEWARTADAVGCTAHRPAALNLSMGLQVTEDADGTRHQSVVQNVVNDDLLNFEVTGLRGKGAVTAILVASEGVLTPGDDWSVPSA